MSCYAIWNELNTWNIVLYMIMVWSNVEFDLVVLWPSQSICSVYNTKPIWYVLCDNLNEKCRRVEVYHSQGINTKSGYILCNRKILLVITVVNGNLLTTIAEPAIDVRLRMRPPVMSNYAMHPIDSPNCVLNARR